MRQKKIGFKFKHWQIYPVLALLITLVVAIFVFDIGGIRPMTLISTDNFDNQSFGSWNLSTGSPTITSFGSNYAVMVDMNAVTEQYIAQHVNGLQSVNTRFSFAVSSLPDSGWNYRDLLRYWGANGIVCSVYAGSLNGVDTIGVWNGAENDIPYTLSANTPIVVEFQYNTQTGDCLWVNNALVWSSSEARTDAVVAIAIGSMGGSGWNLNTANGYFDSIVVSDSLIGLTNPTPNPTATPTVSPSPTPFGTSPSPTPQATVSPTNPAPTLSPIPPITLSPTYAPIDLGVLGSYNPLVLVFGFVVLFVILSSFFYWLIKNKK